MSVFWSDVLFLILTHPLATTSPHWGGSLAILTRAPLFFFLDSSVPGCGHSMLAPTSFFPFVSASSHTCHYSATDFDVFAATRDPPVLPPVLLFIHLAWRRRPPTPLRAPFKTTEGWARPFTVIANPGPSFLRSVSTFFLESQSASSFPPFPLFPGGLFLSDKTITCLPRSATVLPSRPPFVPLKFSCGRAPGACLVPLFFLAFSGRVFTSLVPAQLRACV